MKQTGSFPEQSRTYGTFKVRKEILAAEKLKVFD
jgi:hypothetical protein